MIRAISLKDIPTIQQIAKISWSNTYTNIIPDNIQQLFLEKAYSNTMLAKRIEKTIFLLAELEGKIVGFANFTHVDEDGDTELTAIYILPEYKKLGFGKQLLYAGLNEMPTSQQLFVYVDSKNEDARLFYERLGFDCLEEFEEDFEGYTLTTAKYVYLLKSPTY